MIYWITGNSGSGKTTLAGVLARGLGLSEVPAIVLDGDDMRTVWKDLGLSRDDRHTQNERTGALAKLLEAQGFNVVVSTICPFAAQRERLSKELPARFIYLPGGKEGPDYPYQKELV